MLAKLASSELGALHLVSDITIHAFELAFVRVPACLTISGVHVWASLRISDRVAAVEKGGCTLLISHYASTYV